MKVLTTYVVTTDELKKIIAKYIESVNDLVYIDPDHVTYAQTGQGEIFALYKVSE